jgi:hypothetical protein
MLANSLAANCDRHETIMIVLVVMVKATVISVFVRITVRKDFEK